VSADAAAEALLGGALAIVPTDTVYGLAALADDEAAVRRLYAVKERPATQPTGLVAGSVEALLERLPELAGESERIVRALLPGPYTLVLPNPARRFPWLTGSTPEAIGVRVPAVSGDAQALLLRVGAVCASSANARGGRDPRSVDDVPPAIRALAAATLDVGPLRGEPSTVLDLTAEPRVLREGAVPAAEALRAVASVL